MCSNSRRILGLADWFSSSRKQLSGNRKPVHHLPMRDFSMDGRGYPFPTVSWKMTPTQGCGRQNPTWTMPTDCWTQWPLFYVDLLFHHSLPRSIVQKPDKINHCLAHSQAAIACKERTLSQGQGKAFYRWESGVSGYEKMC